jgi:hypothetical protein
MERGAREQQKSRQRKAPHSPVFFLVFIETAVTWPHLAKAWLLVAKRHALLLQMQCVEYFFALPESCGCGTRRTAIGRFGGAPHDVDCNRLDRNSSHQRTQNAM